MFSNGSYAKIKNVDNKGNYTICNISISKKNKQTGKYETSFVGKVRFVGKAHNQKPQENQRIKIGSCGVSNCYIKDDKLEFLQNPTYTIFDYELQEDGGGSTTSQRLVLEEIDENSLPF